MQEQSRSIGKDQLGELCFRLGFSPKDVQRIEILPERVEVDTYVRDAEGAVVLDRSWVPPLPKTKTHVVRVV